MSSIANDDCSSEARRMERVTRLLIRVRINRMTLRLRKADFQKRFRS